MHRITLALLSVASLAATAPAAAFATVELESRRSINHFYWFGGFAISGDEGHDGAPTPPAGPPWEGVEVTEYAPATLAIAGSAYKELEYLFWAGFLSETWDQAQTYSFGADDDGARVTGSGHATSTQDSIICSDITGCSLATELHRSTNILQLQFSLTEANPYTLTGSTSGGQWIDLLIWNDPAQRWFPIVHGPTLTKDRSFELGGTLEAGLYMLSNINSQLSAGGTTNVVNTWSYQFDLPGAVAVPVPEPAPALLLALGLAAGALLRRRPVRAE
jgi:hypothetical protein